MEKPIKKKRGFLQTALLITGGLFVLCCVLSIAIRVINPTPASRTNTPTPAQAAAPQSSTATLQPPPPSVTPAPATAAPTLTPTSGTPKPTDTPLPAPKPTATLPPATQTAQAAAHELAVLEAAGRSKFGQYFKGAKIGNALGRSVATVDYDLGAQWDEGTSVFTAGNDFMKFAPQVFSSTSVDTLELRSYTDFKDALGNTKNDVALKFTITRLLANKMNWSGLTWREISRALATDPTSNGVYVHPALRAAWAKEQK